MNNQQAYDAWSSTYDDVENKTRDLEKVVAQRTLSEIKLDRVIEIGCGTGKNTEWLAQKTTHVTAMDFSEQMLAKARDKIKAPNINFIQTDVTKPWNINISEADAALCSLILEHIENLNFVFQQVHQHLKIGGHFYVCELHPFKQYAGSKARFESNGDVKILECFVHHITDYTSAAFANNFTCIKLEEWFDDHDRSGLPRLVSFLFRKM